MTRTPLNILIIEDDHEDYLLTREVLLEAREWQPHIEWARTYEQGIEALETSQHDVYLVDYHLGAKTGLDVIAKAGVMHIQKPFILLTGRGDYDIDIQALSLGAADYLEKGRITPNVLERSIRYALKRNSNILKLQTCQERLEEAAERLQRLGTDSNLDLDTLRNAVLELSAQLSHDIVARKSGP